MLRIAREVTLPMLPLYLYSLLAISNAGGANPIPPSTARGWQSRENAESPQRELSHGPARLTSGDAISMSPENFDVDTARPVSTGSAMQFGKFLGRQAIYLPSGLLRVKGTKFRDGKVDVDVASKPGGLFFGIAFRVESEANMEIIYFRPSASDTIEAVQYTPRLNGDAIWQLHNSRHD